MTAEYKETPHEERVTWRDHSGNYGGDDFTLAEIAKRVRFDVVTRTGGMLVYEDHQKIVLASEARIDEDYDEAKFGRYTTIYKVCIIERVVLEAKKGTCSRLHPKS